MNGNQPISAAHRPTIQGTRHTISAGQYLAAEAGFKVLEAGGNAIDAGVTAGITIGVVQCEYVNFCRRRPHHDLSRKHR